MVPASRAVIPRANGKADEECNSGTIADEDNAASRLAGRRAAGQRTIGTTSRS
jgi:hypothetical protein